MTDEIEQGGGGAGGGTREDVDTDRFLSGGVPDFTELFLFTIALWVLTAVEFTVEFLSSTFDQVATAARWVFQQAYEIGTAPLTAGTRGIGSAIESSFLSAAAELSEFGALSFLAAAMLTVVWFLAVERLWSVLRRWI